MLLDQQLHDDAALIEAHLDTLTKDFDRDYPWHFHLLLFHHPDLLLFQVQLLYRHLLILFH